MMAHRKEEHKLMVRICNKFIVNNCKFTVNACLFLGGKGTQNENDKAVKIQILKIRNLKIRNLKIQNSALKTFLNSMQVI